MSKHAPYTHITLKEDPEPLKGRYEVRVSTFVEFDADPGMRAISGRPSKSQALEIAKEIARREKARTGG